MRRPCFRRYFNPRTHVGCDAEVTASGPDTAKFQSTHPRGVRPPRLRTYCPPSLNFNPRTHVGCDKGASAQGETAFQFQSTHPRGVRHYGRRLQYSVQAISIHAPTWGATRMSFWRSSRGLYFNPRTHVGCDKLTRDDLIEMALFQSTHPRGVRPEGQGAGRHRQGISIHAPTWGAT